ncbi:ABC transporter permease, partial [Clostridium sporogenes]|nr:ABC transporter permease [Clostridium sporogenes]
MFFLVTITSAMAFTSIGAVSAFWVNKEAEVDRNFPQAFFYASNRKDYKKLDFIEASLKKEGYNYTKVQGQIKSIVSKKDTIPINIINESTYNMLNESLGQERIHIKSNESIEGSPLMINKRDNILVDNMDIKVVTKLKER